jgi:hypothetical protein
MATKSDVHTVYALHVATPERTASDDVKIDVTKVIDKCQQQPVTTDGTRCLTLNLGDGIHNACFTLHERKYDSLGAALAAAELARLVANASWHFQTRFNC